MPDEVLELILMEKFGWTPTQIAEISFQKVQSLLTVMDVRAKVSRSSQAAKEALDGAEDKVIGELKGRRK